ncbi:winged helix DNA-binding domain-containing protein [Agromyces sp. S2-1-8]|uniref:winged helix DNA-binding domain-containing protein n=1 Tax=Agromyces sp. S2-1-8 TaxID=2897180 RepID=UPI001E3A29BA|nr:winged helix DNA-binding domain-containing protein [Agromyces sp. S2-1-8]MCD5348149.1 winged helix DNA-binding domain-containing protein [Agromyces sp. S2-1-8]
MTTDRDIARWRLRSQSLATPRDDAEQVVRSLLALQAENASQSAWAVATRTSAPEAADLADALASGRVIRTHVLRPTWHYVHADDVRWLLELTAPRVLPVFDQQLTQVADRMTAIADTIERVLGEASDRTRADLGAALAERGTELTGQQLMLVVGKLEMLGLVCSGAPRDGEHTYALMSERVPPARPFDRDEALAELALRYCTSHGPATERDLAYWATLTVTDARRGIAAAADRLESFEHDGRTFWHARGGPAAGALVPAGHLLQVLDEMYRGYQDSRWVIDSEGVVPRERETAIGMALVDAQLVAAMKRTVTAKAVTFALRPHRALDARERQAIDDAAARYAAFLGLEPRVTFDAA